MSKPFSDRRETRLTKQIQCDCPHNGEISRGIAIAQRSLILLENRVFRPMQLIFNVPVLANSFGKASRISSRVRELI
ncbi:hypothetical protein, partial [Coleofasciculus sp. FACHB-1120]|uniref:hypothetical protein n=1 Tax=Coleofasciculus sp. FACHB-1120 TaxID=2692783 RepID=UPI001A7F0016